MNDASDCAGLEETDDFVMKTYFLVLRIFARSKKESNRKNVSKHFSSTFSFFQDLPILINSKIPSN